MPYAAVLMQNGQPVQTITNPAWLTPGDIGRDLGIPALGRVAAVIPGGRGYRFDEGPYKNLILFIATHNAREPEEAIGFGNRDEHESSRMHGSEPPISRFDPPYRHGCLADWDI